MSDRVKNDSPKAPALTAESLPLAVGNLFAINNYDVVYDVNINGAQVDLIATAKSDPELTTMSLGHIYACSGIGLAETQTGRAKC